MSCVSNLFDLTKVETWMVTSILTVSIYRLIDAYDVDGDYGGNISVDINKRNVQTLIYMF